MKETVGVWEEMEIVVAGGGLDKGINLGEGVGIFEVEGGDFGVRGLLGRG